MAFYSMSYSDDADGFIVKGLDEDERIVLTLCGISATPVKVADMSVAVQLSLGIVTHV
jgi:hypothetical protein